MFNNISVKHKIFGDGIISNFELNALNELNSKITVEFESGETKKFLIKTFKDFFTSNNTNIDSYIDRLKLDEAEKEAAKKVVISTVKHIPACHYDENARIVNTADWVTAYNLAGEYRWPHQSRAVIMNEELIFINASAGLKHIDINHKYANRVYDVCDHKVKQKKYADCLWRYATKEEIYENCLKGKNI